MSNIARQTKYYVQAMAEGGNPEIVYHTVDKKKNEYYHEFLDRAKANNLLKKEKEAAPKCKFRVVKVTTTYEATQWQ